MSAASSRSGWRAWVARFPDQLCVRCGEAYRPRRKSQRYCSKSCAAHEQPKREAQPLAERIYSRIDKSGECWLWTGHRDTFGHGRLGNIRAHRAAYELANGPVPPGLMVRHLCSNPACVRPDHLAVGTQLDNMADMVAAGRSARGERHPQSKLTADQVRHIRVLCQHVSIRAIAAAFGVGRTTVSGVVSRRRWGHV